MVINDKISSIFIVSLILQIYSHYKGFIVYLMSRFFPEVNFCGFFFSCFLKIRYGTVLKNDWKTIFGIAIVLKVSLPFP